MDSGAEIQGWHEESILRGRDLGGIIRRFRNSRLGSFFFRTKFEIANGGDMELDPVVLGYDQSICQ